MIKTPDISHSAPSRPKMLTQAGGHSNCAALQQSPTHARIVLSYDNIYLPFEGFHVIALDLSPSRSWCYVLIGSRVSAASSSLQCSGNIPLSVKKKKISRSSLFEIPAECWLPRRWWWCRNALQIQRRFTTKVISLTFVWVPGGLAAAGSGLLTELTVSTSSGQRTQMELGKQQNNAVRSLGFISNSLYLTDWQMRREGLKIRKNRRFDLTCSWRFRFWQK